MAGITFKKALVGLFYTLQLDFAIAKAPLGAGL